MSLHTLAAEQPLGIMGGAFDPVHYGHLRTALELTELLELGEMRFIPSGNPPHRTAHLATAAARTQMLEVALQAYPWASVDTRELSRQGASWSILTLEELRAENPTRSLCMVVGMDAFLGLSAWHRWEELIELAHIVVACRPGSALTPTGALADFLSQRETHNPADLHRQVAGHVYIHAVTQLEISSSAIREQLRTGRSIEFLAPPAVCQLIEQLNCYTNTDTESKERSSHA